MKRLSPYATRGISDLKPSVMRHLKDVADQDPAIYDVLIFGSYARGEADPSSDIDVCLIVDTEQKGVLEALCDDEQAVRAALGPHEYDLVGFPASLYGKPRPEGQVPLLDRIEREGVSACGR